MRAWSVLPLSLPLLLLPLSAASAQGRVLEYGQSGMRADLQRFYAEAQRDVSDVLDEWRSAWEHGRPDQLARLYDAEAVLYPVAGGLVRGRRAIQQHFSSAIGEDDRVQFELLDFGASGDLAYLAGRMFVSGAGGGTEIGTAFLVLRRNDLGGWRIVSHVAKPETAAAP